MSKNNIKLLTTTQLDALRDKYSFELVDSEILVRTTTIKRITRHPDNASFHINARPIRKVSFSIEAINIWKELYDSKHYNLLDVQQAVNVLTVTYQKLTKEAVIQLIETGIKKLKFNQPNRPY